MLSCIDNHESQDDSSQYHKNRGDGGVPDLVADCQQLYDERYNDAKPHDKHPEDRGERAA